MALGAVDRRMDGLARHVWRPTWTLAALQSCRASVLLERPMRPGRTTRRNTLGAGWAGVGRAGRMLEIPPARRSGTGRRDRARSTHRLSRWKSRASVVSWVRTDRMHCSMLSRSLNAGMITETMGFNDVDIGESYESFSSRLR